MGHLDNLAWFSTKSSLNFLIGLGTSYWAVSSRTWACDPFSPEIGSLILVTEIQCALAARFSFLDQDFQDLKSRFSWFLKSLKITKLDQDSVSWFSWKQESESWFYFSFVYASKALLMKSWMIPFSFVHICLAFYLVIGPCGNLSQSRPWAWIGPLWLISFPLPQKDLSLNLKNQMEISQPYLK